MKFVEATDQVMDSLRKMSSVSRSYIKKSPRRKHCSFLENSSGKSGYRGPFMAKRTGDFIRVESPVEFMGGYTGFAGSICAPDMQILKHVKAFDVSFTEGQEKTLCCLVVTWGTSGISVSWGFYADPWKTCVDTDRLVTADEANPKTETNPMRDPFISIYPIFRMEGNRIVQIQHGHIVEFNRWWRS